MFIVLVLSHILHESSSWQKNIIIITTTTTTASASEGVWKLHWAALVGIPHKATAAHVVFATTTTGVASERNTIMDTTQSNPTRFSKAWYNNTDPATVDDHPAPTLNCLNSRELRPNRPFPAAQPRRQLNFHSTAKTLTIQQVSERRGHMLQLDLIFHWNWINNQSSFFDTLSNWNSLYQTDAVCRLCHLAICEHQVCHLCKWLW